MKVIIACEFSGVVRNAFRALGHEAYSCDLSPSKDNSEYHFQQDVLELLAEQAPSFDLMIAHPPCTHLASSGARYFATKRADGRMQQAIDFFMALMNQPIHRIFDANPVGIMSSQYRKPDQIIQPWQFGHPESKSTCLWFKNLSPLMPTQILAKPEKGYWDNQTPSGQNKLGPSADRAMIRSVTYSGIAQAMAEQWG